MSTIINTIRTDLHARFGHAVDTNVIDTLLDETYQRHLGTAVLDEFVPVLVEREVSEKLEAMGALKRQRIVFVARDNRTLADAAVALTRSMSFNVVATSAPTHPENFGDTALEGVLADRGLDLQTRGNNLPAERVLEAADIVVYMTTGEERDIPGTRQIVWDFDTTATQTAEQARELADDLEARVMTMLHSVAPRTSRRAVTL